jgi:hypothetical protein
MESVLVEITGSMFMRWYLDRVFVNIFGFCGTKQPFEVVVAIERFR